MVLNEVALEKWLNFSFLFFLTLVQMTWSKQRSPDYSLAMAYVMKLLDSRGNSLSSCLLFPFRRNVHPLLALTLCWSLCWPSPSAGPSAGSSRQTINSSLGNKHENTVCKSRDWEGVISVQSLAKMSWSCAMNWVLLHCRPLQCTGNYKIYRAMLRQEARGPSSN